MNKKINTQEQEPKECEHKYTKLLPNESILCNDCMDIFVKINPESPNKEQPKEDEWEKEFIKDFDKEFEDKIEENWWYYQVHANVRDWCENFIKQNFISKKELESDLGQLLPVAYIRKHYISKKELERVIEEKRKLIVSMTMEGEYSQGIEVLDDLKSEIEK